MADENVAGSVVVRVKADLSDLERGLDKAKQKTIDWGDKTEAAAKKVDKATSEAKAFTSSLSKVGEDAAKATRELDLVGIVVEELTAGLMRTVGPAALAGAAFTAASAAAVAGWRALMPEVKSVDEVLKQHEENVRRLGPAYEDALKALQKYADESTRLANLRFRTDAADALKTRADEATKAIENMVKSEGIFSSRFSGAKGAIDAFIASIKAGNPEAIKFQETIARLVESGDLTEKVGQDLIVASNAAYEAEQRLRGIDGQVNAVAKALSDMARVMDDDATSALSRLSDAQRKYVEGLIDQLKRGQITADQFKSSLQSLSGVTPDFSGAIAQVSGLADELERANRAALGLANTTPTTRRLGAMDDAQAQYDSAFSMWRRFGYDNDSKIDPNKPKKTRADHSAERDAKAYQQVLKAADDRIKQMQTELDLMGKVGVEADTLRNYQDLLARATDRGRTVGEKQKKELHDRAEAMAKLEDATKKAKLMQDLLFDRDQMFRSSTDQIIAETMRSAGLGINFDSPIAGMIRFNEQLQMAKDYADDFASTFVDGIMNGENALDALGDAASSVLSNIAKQLIQMAMNQMINSLLQGLGGAFGGGFGSGFTANTSLTSYLTGDSWSGLRLAGGGSVRGPGSATSDNIIARLSPGEFVVNAASAQKYLPLLEAINKTPAFASGGRVSEGIAPLRSALMFGGEAALPHADRNGRINVAVYNNGQPVDATAKQSTDGNGDRLVEIFLEKKIEDQVTRPSASTNRSLRQSFGLSQQVVRR